MAKKLALVLGVKAKDVVTGYEGIVTAKVEYLTGCTQFCLVRKVDKDGKTASEYFDDKRLVVTGAGVNVAAFASGGPQRDVPKH